MQSESWRPRPGLPVHNTQIKCLARNLPGVTQSGSQPAGGPWRSLIFLKAKTSIVVCYAKLLQSHQTLCDPLFTLWTWGSSVHQIFQARILEWAAISYSRGTSRPRKFLHLLWFLPWQADSLPLYHLGSPQALDLDFQTVSGWCWLPGLLPKMSHQSGPLPWGITLCYLFLLMHPWDSGTSPNF